MHYHPNSQRNAPLFICIALLLFSAALLAQESNRVLEISDPLTNGQTLGKQIGGIFVPGGWKTQTAFDYIQYDIPTCAAGEIEFDVQGIYASNEVFPNVSYDKEGNVIPGEENVHYSFFNMYDRDDSNLWYGVRQWHNPYKCIMHIYGYVPGDIWKWRYMKLRLNVSAYTSGYDDDPHAFEDPIIGPFDWQREQVYHHRLVWGNGHMRWYMDEQLIKDWDYSSFGVEYAPPDHSIRIGSGFTAKGGAGFKAPLLITFSNFKFYRHQDLTPPAVLSVEPSSASGGVSVDSDILVHFSEPMEQAATVSAFSIEPAVAGELRWVENALYFEKTELLQPSTTYTIRISTAASDKAGHTLPQAYEHRFTTAGVTAATVGRYEEFEIPLIATSLGNRNRYKEVWLKGEFRGPSRIVEIEGFWDGGDVWKVRMAPTELGTWNYTITGSEPTFSASGSFECVESNSKGFIRSNPARPYTFMYDDGTPFLWRGDTSWRGYTSLLSYEGRWQPYIDLRASQGYTVVQSIVVSYIGGMNFWKNEGGLCFVENADSKDYDQLNPDYFHWIDKRIDYALSKGIVPVMLFTWAQEYANFTREQFERFERYLIARFAAKNVIWCISGEYDEVPTDFGIPTSEFAEHGRIIQQYDPYDHLITLHPTGRSTSAEFANEPWFGFIMQQTPYYVRDIQRDRQYNKPVVNGEPRYMYVGEDNTESRQALWEIVTSGGFYTTGFIPTYAPDKGGWDPAALPDEQRWVEVLNKYLERTHWWEMDPHPEWMSAGQLLAKPGAEYLAYNRSGGPVSIDLSHFAGPLSGEWINPMTGSKESLGSVQGGGLVNLTPPFAGDWALHLGEGVKQDSIPPNPPLAASSPSQTMNTIALTWQPPSPAEDGDRAQSYLIYRNGVQIATTTSTNYTDQGLAEDTAYQYSIFALDSEGNKSTAAAELTVSTSRDAVPPEPVEVKLISENQLAVIFNEKVEKNSAEEIGNYSITPAIQITSAVLSPNSTTATLTTGTHSTNQVYSLTIDRIADLAKTPNLMSGPKTLTYKLDAGLRISDINPSSYRLDTLQVNDPYYTDRDFKLVQIPAICSGYAWIMTENDDKNQSDAHWLSFRVNVSVSVLIGFDKSITPLPQWLSDWENTGEQIVTTDDSPLLIYRKDFPAGDVVLGANEGGDKGSMYIVLVGQGTGNIKDTRAPAIPNGFKFSQR